ncbi:MAG: hypothetical protein DRJ38_03465 [Thermoprotei archaeon]|nr:MAG: hypothetical protein DRJ38_03465 [Thermoprotei archaeon]
MRASVIEAENARIAYCIGTGKYKYFHAKDPYLHSLANLLVDNKESAGTIEITSGRVKLLFHDDAVIAVTGDCEVKIGNTEASPWQALPVAKGSCVEVSSNSIAYIAVVGGFETPYLVLSLAKNRVLGFFSNGRLSQLIDELPARRIPQTFRRKSGEFKDGIYRAARSLKAALEAYKRGAKLVRVKVNGRVYEAWVEEIA